MSHASIAGVQFTLRGTPEIKDNSSVQVKNFNEYVNNNPAPGGVRDLKMGTTIFKFRCQICDNTKGKCLGHNGHYMLKHPIINPMGFERYKKWLKVVCHVCGAPVVEPPARAVDRLSASASSTREKNRICPKCGSVHPILKPDETEKMCMVAYIYDDTKERTIKNKYNIYPHNAEKIFSRVTPETIKFYCGSAPIEQVDPRKTIITATTVPTNIIRPDVRQTGEDRSLTKSITSLLMVLIRANEKFPENYEEIFNDAIAKKDWEINRLYYEMLRASGKETVSIVGDFKGKTGLFRGAILGKRSRGIARSTIVGDPTLRIDEIRISQKFATTIKIDVAFQDYNRAELMLLLQNGSKRYPGASTITKRNGKMFDVSENTDLSSLEPGDIISRDVLDGDYVYFNRQPSLMPSNISGFRVYVSRDPNDNTIGMPPAVCPMFNADFDGDAMNIIFATSPAGMAEIELLGWMGLNFIHFSTSNCMIGQSEDSVISLFELTRRNTRLDKFHACLTLSTIIRMPDLNNLFADRQLITGRECASVSLENIPIDLTRSTNWYNPSFIPAVKYHPDEITAVIRQGKLISGELDKKTVGRGAQNSIYQIIANDHGNKKAIEAIYDMLRIATEYMKIHGFTIGLQDILLSREARDQVEKITGDTITRCELIIEQLIRGEVVPPMGVTVAEQYEKMQLAAAQVYDGYIDVLLQNIDHDKNHLFKLAASGSKGSINNMANIVSAVGQKVLNGQRPPKMFGHHRTLPYFQRYDMSPEANGFIKNSFVQGINTAEMISAGMCSRWALIIKALASSISGAMSREAIKCMESLVVNYFRHITIHNKTLAFSIGDDNLNPQKIEPLKIATVSLSDADFASKYKNDEIASEFEQLSADRKKYRDLFLRLESATINEPFQDTRQLAVNISRIIDGVLGRGTSKPLENSELLTAYNIVNEFCAALPYVYYNAGYKRAGKVISETFKCATWLLSMQVRVSLCTREISRRSMSLSQLQAILARVEYIYSRALVDPGATIGMLAAMGFSEPNMQMMMDAHRASATGGNSLSGTKRAKEVFSIKPTKDMAAPEMILQFTQDIASDKSKIQRIANNLEVMRFSTFISGTALIFAETYGVPVHPDYKHESEFIKEFQHRNPLLAPPQDLLHFCIRYELDKSQLLLKNMEIDHIATRLRASNNNLYVIYTHKNAPRVIMRVYIRGDQFKTTPGKNDLESLDATLQDIILRGMPGIVRANPIKLVRHKVAENGSIIQDNNNWGVQTVGTNIAAGLLVSGVIPELVFSNSIMEIYEMFGIEAARTALINECRRMMPSCNYRHYTVYAKTITRLGYPTSINKTGVNSREPNNVLLAMGYSNPADALGRAVSDGIYNPIYGISSALAIGTTPNIGSKYTKIQINKEFIAANSKSVNKEFSDLFSA